MTPSALLGFRDAVTALNQAIDLAHAAGISPDRTRALVTGNTCLGPGGKGYLAEEILEWDRVYDLRWQPTPLPSPDNPDACDAADLYAMHARPRPADSGSAAVAEQALAAAALCLAQAEAALTPAESGTAADQAFTGQARAGLAAAPALGAESFPLGPAAGPRPGSGAPVPSGLRAHTSARAHPDQTPQATRGHGPR